MDFNLEEGLGRFVDNLQYMGIGMLGIFLIIGIIIGATYLIPYIIKKIEDKKKGED